MLLVKILSDIENGEITLISTSTYHSYILVTREDFSEKLKKKKKKKRALSL